MLFCQSTSRAGAAERPRGQGWGAGTTRAFSGHADLSSLRRSSSRAEKSDDVTKQHAPRQHGLGPSQTLRSVVCLHGWPDGSRERTPYPESTQSDASGALSTQRLAPLVQMGREGRSALLLPGTPPGWVMDLKKTFQRKFTECVPLTELYPTLCDPVDCSPPGSSIHGILQAQVLEWVAIPFSRESSLIQGRNPGVLHGRQILHHLSHQGSPMFKVSVLKRNAPQPVTAFYSLKMLS